MARIELSDGNWAEVREKAKVRDSVAVRMAAHERGFDDDFLNVVVGLKSRISEWSYGEVSDEAILDLDSDDLLTLLRETAAAAGSADDPKVSSLAGARTKRAKKLVTPPGSGE